MGDLRIYRRSELEAVKPAIDAEGCLHRYRMIWMEGADDTSDVALVGIAFAAIKHRYIERLLAIGASQDFEEATEAFKEGIAAEGTPSRLIPEVRQLWIFHAEKFALDIPRFVAAEERGSTGDVGWAPDLVLAHPETDTLEVIDDKSGWHPPISEDELRVLFQARVYSRYARDRWPHFTHYRFTLNAVRFNKAVSVSFTQEELDAVDVEVAAAIAAILEAEKTGQWPATPGPSCHFCTLACPVADQAITLPKRLDVVQIPKLAAWLLVADKQLKAAKKLLKGAVTVHGPVTVNGVVWDNRPSESVSYPLAAVLDVLRLRNIAGAFEGPEMQDLTITHSALAKLFKQFPMLEEDLLPVRRSKTTYRFGAKAAGQDDDGAEE